MLSTKFMKCLKRQGLTIWKLVLLYLHAVRNNLPLILFLLFFVQAFLIYKTEFYADYYVWFDYIDTAFYIFICYDVITQIYNNYVSERMFKYNESNGICCVILFALLLLNLCFYQFEIKDYINIYKAILLGGAIALFLTYIKE